VVDFDKLIDYEEGKLSETEAIELFKDLIETGAAWTLQGHYGRTAEHLIDTGHIQLHEGRVVR
jgi:hypothetical protein